MLATTIRQGAMVTIALALTATPLISELGPGSPCGQCGTPSSSWCQATMGNSSCHVWQYYDIAPQGRGEDAHVMFDINWYYGWGGCFAHPSTGCSSFAQGEVEHAVGRRDTETLLRVIEGHHGATINYNAQLALLEVSIPCAHDPEVINVQRFAMHNKAGVAWAEAVVAAD